MAEATVRNGWVHLPCGCDLELRHGVPVRLSCGDDTPDIKATTLSNEVTAMTGLRVSLGEWQPGDEDGELQSRVRVSGEQLAEVLNRLALSSAAIFFDRYHKTPDREDVDWDTLEYANDFRRALEHCGLDWEAVDREACKPGYLEAMHAEIRRLSEALEPPLIEPETD